MEIQEKELTIQIFTCRLLLAGWKESKFDKNKDVLAIISDDKDIKVYVVHYIHTSDEYWHYSSLEEAYEKVMKNEED